MAKGDNTRHGNLKAIYLGERYFKSYYNIRTGSTKGIQIGVLMTESPNQQIGTKYGAGKTKVT